MHCCAAVVIGAAGAAAGGLVLQKKSDMNRPEKNGPKYFPNILGLLRYALKTSLEIFFLHIFSALFMSDFFFAILVASSTLFAKRLHICHKKGKCKNEQGREGMWETMFIMHRPLSEEILLLWCSIIVLGPVQVYLNLATYNGNISFHLGPMDGHR